MIATRAARHDGRVSARVDAKGGGGRREGRGVGSLKVVCSAADEVCAIPTFVWRQGR